MLASLTANHPIIVSAPIAFWTFIGATLIPVLTALITKSTATAGVKAVVNGILAAAAGIVAYAVLHDGSFDVWSSVLTMASAAFISWASYAGLMRQTIVKKVENSTVGPRGLG